MPELHLAEPHTQSIEDQHPIGHKLTDPEQVFKSFGFLKTAYPSGHHVKHSGKMTGVIYQELR